ncbi:MAG TPA: nucleotide exchange factor GrpE [Bacilli bacterium]|jgi:molecular chaperone GrpE|nr:MAG: heat shock protein GrpE [Tenericutes bacterium ADurb.Bin140]HOE77370.1 nucleotide exchange factor GrpE [Bacilli bacterium]HON63754.1 nucleotide exchange factor GrpE [Bacilli bacterium]HOR95644.1 nucleotide exchange factor GrpE [Bacilli bacterium]HPK58490.1 nucleotide exchange factor GrpE [Bacilli bacterium]
MSEFNRYREEEKEQEQQEQENASEALAKEEGDQPTDSHDSCCEKCQSEASEECACQQKEDELAVCQAEIAKLKEEIAQLNDQLLRNRAELENFKRRTNEERIRERKYALQSFFADFIHITDIFNKAVQTETDDEKLKKFLAGFQLINTQIQTLMAQYGVKPIEAKNQKFDPNLHSAAETVWVEGVDEDVIVEEIITGYMYKDRILRPSIVKVNKASAKSIEEKEEKNNG